MYTAQMKQGKCQACHSFMWKIYRNPETQEIEEIKCGRCDRILQVKKGIVQVVAIQKEVEQ